MVLVSIASVWPEQNAKVGKAIWKQTRPKIWSNGLAGKDVGWANLWSCAGVVVSKKVQDDDANNGKFEKPSPLLSRDPEVFFIDDCRAKNKGILLKLRC